MQFQRKPYLIDQKRLTGAFTASLWERSDEVRMTEFPPGLTHTQKKMEDVKARCMTLMGASQILVKGASSPRASGSSNIEESRISRSSPTS